MPTSVSDVINLGASGVTIAGAIFSAAAYVRKMVNAPPPPPAPPVVRPNPPAPPPGYPASQPGYPPAYPVQQQPGYPAPSYPQPQRQPGYPQPTQPSYSQGAWQAGAPLAQPHPLRIPHPALLAFATLGLVCALGYSLTLLFQYFKTGSTDIAAGSPLFYLNILWYVGDLIGGSVAIIGMSVAATRARAWGWLTVGLIGGVIALFTAGILAVVGLVPAFLYALYGPPTPRR